MDIGDFKLDGLTVLDQASIHTVQAYKSIEVRECFYFKIPQLNPFLNLHLLFYEDCFIL